MGLSEQVKDHIIVILAGAFAAGAALSWGVAEKVRLAPKDEQIGILERRIEDLKQNTSSSGAETTKIAQLEAEVKKLSAELGKAQRALDARGAEGSNKTDKSASVENTGSKDVTAVFGFSQEKLAARLLDLLQPRSEDDLRSVTLLDRCAGPFVTPEAKVEILAYLTSGELALRRKAVLAYANCASGVNEAFLLARTIKPNEAPEFFDAYAFGIWAIIKHEGDRTDMRHMKSYLVEIGAPRDLLTAFLARADSQEEGSSLGGGNWQFLSGGAYATQAPNSKPAADGTANCAVPARSTPATFCGRSYRDYLLRPRG